MNEQAYSLVLETLQQAASQNPEVLKPAEEKLKSWNTEPGFHSYLVNILKNRNIDNTVRWLGVLCLKNGVDKYWRKNAPNEIDRVEKQSLRQTLLSEFQEPVPQIELQVAVVIAKIARFDWPSDWPELVPTLLTAVQAKDSKTQDGALITWQHVVKALSSKRLCGDRKLFQDLTADLFPFMIELYMLHLKVFLTEATDNKNLRRCLSCVKLLRKLLLFGFKKPHESPHVVQFVSEVFPQISTMQQLENHPSIDKQLLHKYVCNLAKVPLEFHEHHPFSFVPFLQQCLEFCVSLAFSLPSNASSWTSLANEKLLMLSLNLLKNILLCKEYWSPLAVAKTYGPTQPEVAQADSVLKGFFTQQLLEHVTLSLVVQYLPLTQSELTGWDEDPEASVCDEGGESWKYAMRPCIETLFLTIFHKYSGVLRPALLSLLNEYRPLVEPTDMQRILVKDAVYNAVGLAAFDLYDEIDMDEWFQSSLRAELAIKHDNYRIIRKRVAWLLGNWTNVKFSSELRPLLYEVLLSLMHPVEDLAVRLSACRAFKMCIDDFDFNTEQFMPFVNIYFNTLYKLLCDAKECDTKMHVLNVCSFLIERMGASIADFADDIFDSLPLLWAQSEEHNLLRAAIVTTLTHLTLAAGKVHPLVPQVIDFCTDTEKEQSLYMMEDGLELWIRVLHQSSSLSPDLDALYPSLLKILKDNTSEYHVPGSKILRAYILLDPISFFSHKVSATVALFCHVLPQLRLEGFTNLAQVLELCVRVVPSPPLASLHPVLKMIIHLLMEETDQSNGFKQSLLLCILSRLILHDSSYFLSLVTEEASRISTSHEALLTSLMEDMISKTRLLWQPERRKVLGLAYATLLTCKSVIILNSFAKIMDQLAEIFNDVMRLPSEGHEFEDAFTDLTELSPDVFQEPTRHDERKKEIARFDPVYSIPMNYFVQTKLSELCSHVGAETFASLVSSVDPEVLKNLQDYISI